MAVKPTVDPKWSTTNNPVDNIEPTASLKNGGVPAGGVWGREFLNWQFFAISQWIDWVRSSALDRDSNLSDLTNVATARTNLGLNSTSVTLGANIATANALRTTRTINGTSFNGTANITTATWGTSRKLNGVDVNGSADKVLEPYVERDDTTNAPRFLTFVDSSTAGYQRLNMDSSLAYNPSANVLNVNASNALTLEGVDSSQFVRSDVDDTVSGDINHTGAISYTQTTGGTGGIHVIRPEGALYASTTATQTGFIKIKLPVWYTGTMMRMVVDIYDYTAGESITLMVGGYSESFGPNWVNTFAQVISSKSDRFFNVRFGDDGTNCAIYIGEITSTWSYLQVSVRDFIGGYSNAAAANWQDGWEITVTDIQGSIKSTEKAVLVASEALKLSNAVTINGTSFDGTANIETATWGTSRSISIGGIPKLVNGSGNITWSRSEMGMLGEGQSWQSVSRAVGITYTNTTGRAICVSIVIRALSATPAGFSFLVNDVVISSDSGTGHIWDHTITAIIPAGHTYRLDAVNNYTLGSWVELR